MGRGRVCGDVDADIGWRVCVDGVGTVYTVSQPGYDDSGAGGVDGAGDLVGGDLGEVQAWAGGCGAGVSDVRV